MADRTAVSVVGGVADRTVRGLRERGFDVEVADRGIDASTVARETDADCLLLCDGAVDDPLAAVRAVRDARPALAVVLLAGTVEAAPALEAGATDHVRRREDGSHVGELAARLEAAVERERDARHAHVLDQVFEQVPVSLYLKDDEARHLRVSHYHEAPEAVVGMTDPEYYGGATSEEAYADDMRVLETGEPIHNREESYEDDSWVLTSKAPWYGRDGEVAGLVGVTRDVTERKHYERELERQNERLEQFAGVVSHDLRNPLNVAVGRLELAREECDSDHLDDVAAALERMDALIDDVLTMARDGRAVEEVERVSLARVARLAWSAVGDSAAEFRIEDDAPLAADPGRFRRILENLLRNAVDHGSTSPSSQAQGDATERSSVGSRTAERSDDAVEHGSTSPSSQAPESADRGSPGGNDPPTVWVGVLDGGDGFYVEDDGPGIPPDEREDVFDPGYSQGDGNGLGLAIVEELAAAHGWTVRATGGRTGGARFEVSGVATPD